MSRKHRADTSREGGRFIALPHSVLEAKAYLGLSYAARALLLELALQYHGDDNGRLLCSAKHLRARGWKSNDVIARAKRELLEAGFIHETVKGHRPNKASWYAVTWITLDKLQGYDPDAAKTFERGAYRKINVLTPLNGAKGASIAPSAGVGGMSVAPSGGAMKGKKRTFSTPYNGHPLDMPSTDAIKTERNAMSQKEKRAQIVADLLDSGRSNLSGVARTFKPTARVIDFSYRPTKHHAHRSALQAAA